MHRNEKFGGFIMRFTIVTLFPDMITPYFQYSILKRAIENHLIEINVVDLRDYSLNKHRHVDDTPYSKTTGMLIQVDVVKRCLDAVKTDRCKVIATTPVGYTYQQSNAQQLADLGEDIVILCGHYEGFDARVYDYCDYRFSIGDFVLTGGELAACVIVDSIARLRQGVIKRDSLEDESFSNGLLEYDQFTRPLEFEGKKVPFVLTNGNHQLIHDWKYENSLKNTKTYRNDLWNDALAHEYDLIHAKNVKNNNF